MTPTTTPTLSLVKTSLKRYLYDYMYLTQAAYFFNPTKVLCHFSYSMTPFNTSTPLLGPQIYDFREVIHVYIFLALHCELSMRDTI